MHGIINRCMEMMIIEKFGTQFWETLKGQASVKLPGDFLVTEFYSDESTYRLVAAAATLTGLSIDKILELYGEYFYIYVVENGYVNLVKVLGKTPMEFLQNLDSMHLALARVYPPMNPPLFVCKTLPNGDLILYYYSKRPGLVPIAVGLIRKVILEVFQTLVDVTITEKDPVKGCYQLLISNLDGQKFELPADDVIASSLNREKQLIGPVSFAQIFPFHMIFNRDLRVLQCGNAMLRTAPHVFGEGVRLNHFARISRPGVPLTFDSIMEHQNSVFLMQIQVNGCAPFRLNGEMVYLEEEELMLYIASPYVVSLDDLHQKKLFITDISLYDAKRDFMLASENFEEERILFKRLEDLTINMRSTSKQLAQEKGKTDALLYEILPPTIARELRLGNVVRPERYERVTILFSGIVDFEKFTAARNTTNTGIEIVELLNEVYSRIDTLLDPAINPEIYKIETVHDSCLVVSGAPDHTVYHGQRVAKFAVDVKKHFSNVTMFEQPIQITMGINSGDVVVGVIGQRMPRYCLFGDTVNLASRTMKYGKSAQVNITQTTYNLLHTPENFDPLLTFELHGEVMMKNVKLPVKVWLMDRKSSPPHPKMNGRTPRKKKTSAINSNICSLL